jgi:hypothetical protein
MFNDGERPQRIGHVAVSPDGSNVLAIVATDESIVELARVVDGSLQHLASPNDCIAETRSTATCSDGTKTAGGVSP